MYMLYTDTVYIYMDRYAHLDRNTVEGDVGCQTDHSLSWQLGQSTPGSILHLF